MTTNIFLLASIPYISDLLNTFQGLDKEYQIAIGIGILTSIAAIISTLLPGLISIIWKVLSFPFRKKVQATTPSPQGTGISAQSGAIIATDTATINNYYGANPEEVKHLKQELNLKNRTIETLLSTIDAQQIPNNERTKAFKQLAEKYQQLQQRLSQYETHPETQEKVKRALENGELDKAEKLLEQANETDKQFIKQRQKVIAERTFNLAEISELKFDYETALQRYQEVTQLNPENLSAWQQLAELSEKIGESQDALRAWQQLQHNAKEQARWKMIGQLGEANILAKHGKRESAMDKYQQAHQWFVQQLKDDPNNSDWQRDLSVSFNKIGDMHKANGDGDNAITAYNNSLNIRETLAKRDPNNSDWQRDLSVSYDNLGNMHKANGDGDNAITAYNNSLNIAETLAKRDPNNSDWQRDLMVSYVKMSDVFPDEKISYLQKALDILIRQKQSNRLYPEDFWIIDELKERLSNAKATGESND